MEIAEIKSLSLKKLYALLDIADEQDREEITKELASRGEPVILSEEPVILSEEPVILSEEPVILSEEPVILSTGKSYKYLTEAEIEKHYKELQKSIGRMARVKRKGEMSWTEAQVVSISYRKRESTFAYAFKTIDNDMIFRSESSDTFVLLDEYRPVNKKQRGKAFSFTETKKLTSEDIERIKEEKFINIGRYANVPMDNSETHCCVITGMSVKRNSVRYILADLDMGGKPVLRSVDDTTVELLDKYDVDIKAGARFRRPLKKTSAEERLIVLEKAMRESEDRYLKARDAFEAIKAEYEKAKMEYLRNGENYKTL